MRPTIKSICGRTYFRGAISGQVYGETTLRPDQKMNAIALILIACLPHTDQCKSAVQHPAPATDKECTDRTEKLVQTLAGMIDDTGYRPVQITCLYGYPERDG